MPSKFIKTARRKVLAGYPKVFIFETPETLTEYFVGESITCLLCGKQYRTLGVHLKAIHKIEPDEYREKYGIPWTYKLSCSETSALHAETAKELIATGKWQYSKEQAEFARSQGINCRKRVPVREELVYRNLKEMNKGKSGEAARRKKNAPKKGTQEYSQKMRDRPQCQPEAVRKKMGGCWKGKKQSPEHIAKRIASRLKTLSKIKTLHSGVVNI